MKIIKAKKTREILRFFLGFIFIVSAILKITSLDTFDIYIYSFGVLGLNTSFLFSRLVISFELLLGLLLVFGLFSKKVVWTSIVTLIAFCIFILFLIITDNNEHCHCFGEQIKMSHTASIFKNILLILFLFFVRKLEDFRYKSKKIILSLIFVFGLSTPFIISPPDNIMSLIHKDKSSYNKEELHGFLKNYKFNGNEKFILAFISAKCEYCQLAAKKMDIILSKSKRKKGVNFVFWGEMDEITKFKNEYNLNDFNHLTISPILFLKITDGKMPLILLIENGKVVQKYGYRNINESEIIDFLSTNRKQINQ